MRAIPISTPGIKPLRNRRATDWSAITQYKIIGTDGGITTPIVPAAAIKAAEKAGSYFFFLSSGINGVPTAAVVAAPIRK